ncbi:adenylate cyclase type 10-like [Liolophura sinensis]|uniref:adenylate cyclase type 10-like n=1 Tax=Liolophura sinensis TaxID=3198878 RepID=UPI003158F350
MAGIFSVITSLRDQLSEERDEIADVTVDKLYPHIPRLVKYADHSNTLPWTQEAQGVLMFADISGFTALCEKYSSLSTAGIDNLTTTLNGYLESLVEQILASEGDVLKFAGDAILAFWPTSHNDATEVIQNVIRCCLDIQERCGDYETNIGVTLSVKMGIAFGDITFSFVGNDEFRHYVESGSAVDDVRMAQALCDPHQVVMSPRAWNQCDHRKFRFVRLSHGKHVRVLSMKEEMETSKYSMKKPSLDNTFITEDSVLASGALTMAETGVSQQTEVGAKKGIRRYNALRKFQRAVSVLGHISKNLRFYVPSPVLRKLDDDQPLEYLSEMRSISVVFVNLTLCDYSNITELMQTLFQTICQHVHTMQGCLNKIFLFDKGCSFLVIFGLPGNKQEHDRDHALQCAVVIAEDLAKEDRVSETSIGVTTGTAFCGVVGHRERHEYSGRKVELDVFSEILQKQTSVDNKLPQTETLVIEADSGMGKTRLLDAMTSRAMAAGFRYVIMLMSTTRLEWLEGQVKEKGVFIARF